MSIGVVCDGSVVFELTAMWNVKCDAKMLHPTCHTSLAYVLLSDHACDLLADGYVSVRDGN